MRRSRPLHRLRRWPWARQRTAGRTPPGETSARRLPRRQRDSNAEPGLVGSAEAQHRNRQPEKRLSSHSLACTGRAAWGSRANRSSTNRCRYAARAPDTPACAQRNPIAHSPPLLRHRREVSHRGAQPRHRWTTRAQGSRAPCQQALLPGSPSEGSRCSRIQNQHMIPTSTQARCPSPYSHPGLRSQLVVGCTPERRA